MMRPLEVRDLTELLHLLARLDSEVTPDSPAHLSCAVLRVVVSRKISEHRAFG